MTKPKLKITHSFDSFECDCCGSNWAEGFMIETEDGKVYGGLAEAACFGGNHYYKDEVLMDFLRDNYQVWESSNEQSETGSHLEDPITEC